MDVVEQLVANHRRFLAFLAPRVGGREAAEEILQAAFVKAVEKRRTVRDGESAVAWFYRLLRNALTDHYRRRSAEGRALARRPPSEPELEKAVCRCIRGLLDTLKPEYAEVVRSVDLGGETPAEAAKRMKTTTNNVTVRLHRARKALHRQLKISCGTCAEHGCLSCTCADPM